MKRNTALRPWNHRDPSNPQLSPPAPLACAGWHTAHGDLLHAQGFPSGPFGSFTISDKPPLSEWSARGCANMEHTFWTNSEVPLLKQPSVLDHEQGASMGCFIPPSLQKHLYIWPSGWATLDQQPFSGRGSSSPTSLCWSMDFSTQVALKSSCYTEAQCCRSNSRGKGGLTLRCPSRVTSRSSCRGIWTGMLRAGHLFCERKNKRGTITQWKVPSLEPFMHFLFSLGDPPQNEAVTEKLKSCCWAPLPSSIHHGVLGKKHYYALKKNHIKSWQMFSVLEQSTYWEILLSTFQVWKSSCETTGLIW